MPSTRQFPRPFPWLAIAMVAVFAFSAGLRFWQLSRFNTLVFDEVYYAKFANNYLTQTQFFNAHPPLSQYIIAIAMWLGEHMPIDRDIVNGLTGSLHSPWSYRWLNALTGSFVPLVVGGIAYQLSDRRSYAVIAAIFAAADGLFLVESRYALNNIYLVILGLLGHWFLLIALKAPKKKRYLWLTLAGTGFGASAAIKWNGLGFLLGVYLCCIVVWIVKWGREQRTGRDKGDKGATTNYQLPITNYQLPTSLEIAFYLGIIPVAIYSISWIPHLMLNPTPNFWEMQREILFYHQRIGSSANVHPYCSRWYTWLLMLRPVAYFYKTTISLDESVPVVGPPLPEASAEVIYDVHAMGNPILWWFSAVAILYAVWVVVKSAITSFGFANVLTSCDRYRDRNIWIYLYFCVNWLANLLPWMRVTRCTFLYHYMGASVFATLALAWIVDRWLRSYHRNLRLLGVTAIFLILIAFVFWMPLYLGLPLSPEGYRWRMWLPSWV
ncbi:phospholipid carrier-dependent glycosyltransferase [Chroococcidiopsis sp. FACHB-1243]|uniref:dolichyl-phosphate-mannose--protein mannosyltransferase n=2 Tax=unclassified Chroococcidiopsis TaxID=2646205 RepID=UPI0017861711|nr:phospholipid carrier-dependent glycosyltransferase [Chroococcidiopsis sp. [FACHB-1243]]MBD2305089.1 phospholipid carrier-dependent glycosyltransferase [Chroococcidiopsis sp. [FACHB-1243]]